MDDTAPEAPTVTTVGTRPQTVLGTAAYMSPEQARGQSVDKRTDIWAFGCVLYEMLTGRRAFGGATLSDTIAAILEHEPDSTQLPADTAGGVRRLLRRCLEQDPKQRLRDIGDARLELQEAIGGVLDPASRSPSGRRGDTGLWFAAGLALTAVTAGVAGWALKPTDHRAITSDPATPITASIHVQPRNFPVTSAATANTDVSASASTWR